jgi:hypothetical protein
MAAPHSAEDSAHYVLTIFKRHKCRTGSTLLAHNLQLPFSQDGWQASDLAAGRDLAVEKGWIEVGKDEKFIKLLEAGYVESESERTYA